jgi:hypothetical protein
MKIFSKRNALLGWIVARVARKRLERRLNRLVHGRPRRRRLLMAATGVAAAGAATGATVALLSRRDRVPAAGAQV